jgi:tRNA C32,U32 (ribose-2'-O)-methylase TrmJ
MLRLYKHIEEVLDYIDFRDRTGGGYLMARIRRLFNRARLDQNEMNILRGILTAVQARRRPALPPKRAGNARTAVDAGSTEKTD